MTNCQQNKQSLDRLEIYPPIFSLRTADVSHRSSPLRDFSQGGNGPQRR